MGLSDEHRAAVGRSWNSGRYGHFKIKKEPAAAGSFALPIPAKKADVFSIPGYNSVTKSLL
jgi:hypothetical protein